MTVLCSYFNLYIFSLYDILTRFLIFLWGSVDSLILFLYKIECNSLRTWCYLQSYLISLNQTQVFISTLPDMPLFFPRKRFHHIFCISPSSPYVHNLDLKYSVVLLSYPDVFRVLIFFNVLFTSAHVISISIFLVTLFFFYLLLHKKNENNFWLMLMNIRVFLHDAVWLVLQTSNTLKCIKTVKHV